MTPQDWAQYKQIQISGSAYSYGTCFGDLVEQAIRDWVAPGIPDKTSSLLDFGCGDGRSIEVFQAMGFTAVTGLELNPDKVQRARIRGFSVIEGDMHDLTSLPQFDHVFTSHTLEHAYDLPTVLLQLGLHVRHSLWCIVPLEPLDRHYPPHPSPIPSVSYFLDLLRAAHFEVKDHHRHHRSDQEVWVLAVPVHAQSAPRVS